MQKEKARSLNLTSLRILGKLIVCTIELIKKSGYGSREEVTYQRRSMSVGRISDKESFGGVLEKLGGVCKRP